MSVTQVDQYNSILVIEHLSSDHTGNYSCAVKNLAAEVDSTQALLVNGNRRFLNLKQSNKLWFFLFLHFLHLQYFLNFVLFFDFLQIYVFV